MNMTRSSPMKRIRPATKIAVGFILVIAGTAYGWKAYSRYQISTFKFDAIPPGEVSLIGVNTGSNYYIVVANRMAQLIQGENKGDERDIDFNNTTGIDSDVKKRIPMYELTKSLQGDTKALGRFLMTMNDISEASLPAYPTVWKAEDIQKVLDGDKALEAKFVKDINVELDGSPLSSFSLKAMEEGIVIDHPVPVRVQVGNKQETLIGRFWEPFTPRFVTEVQRKYQNSETYYTVQTIKGHYEMMAKDLFAGRMQRENVRETLKASLSPTRYSSLSDRPEKILASASVILNENFVVGTNITERKNPDGDTYYDLELQLSDEGRKRLWKFSADRVGSQILVVWDGKAIAAPVIQHELSQSTITIKGIGDRRLVEDTAAALNKNLAGKKND